MEQHATNPTGNTLGAGVSEGDLLSAISGSGYPLQSVAVDLVTKKIHELFEAEGRPAKSHQLIFEVQEEWSYIDSDSAEVRHIDALVSVQVYPLEPNWPEPISDPRELMRINLSLIIECKHSELPFVFFLRPANPGKVPHLAGLPNADILVHSAAEDDLEVSFSMSLYDALGLFELPIASSPPTAISMAKTHRKGRSLELSGEEAYRSLTMALLKCEQHYRELLNRGARPGLYNTVHLLAPVAVLRAPMVGVEMVEGSPKLHAIPWVRLVRVDPDADNMHSTFSQATCIDVVHAEYLAEYTDTIYRSAVEAAARIGVFAVPALTGEAAFASSLEESMISDASKGEKAPYLEMRQIESDAEFMTNWRQRFRDAHSTPTDGATDTSA